MSKVNLGTTAVISWRVSAVDECVVSVAIAMFTPGRCRIDEFRCVGVEDIGTSARVSFRLVASHYPPGGSAVLAARAKSEPFSVPEGRLLDVDIEVDAGVTFHMGELGLEADAADPITVQVADFEDRPVFHPFICSNPERDDG